MENNIENKMENNVENDEKSIKDIKDAISNFIFPCKDCVKNDVCYLKKDGKKKIDCEHYYCNMDYKQYRNIHELFKPIFKWIKFHYPSGEIHFLVDGTSAMMLQEHGTNVYSEEITRFYSNNTKRRR